MSYTRFTFWEIVSTWRRWPYYVLGSNGFQLSNNGVATAVSVLWNTLVGCSNKEGKKEKKNHRAEHVLVGWLVWWCIEMRLNNLNMRVSLKFKYHFPSYLVELKLEQVPELLQSQILWSFSYLGSRQALKSFHNANWEFEYWGSLCRSPTYWFDFVPVLRLLCRSLHLVMRREWDFNLLS